MDKQDGSVLLDKRAEQYIRLQSIVLLALFAIYVVAGYKSFNVWSQLDIFTGVNPLYVLHHPHGLRYLITWPVLWISDYLNIHRNVIFSIFVVVNLICATVLIAAVQARVSSAVEPRWKIWAYLFIPIFVTLSFAMNGRLSYMMLGISIMLYAYTRWLTDIKNDEAAVRGLLWLSLNALALMLLSVSSGCFTVGMLVVMLMTVILAIMSNSGKQCVLNVLLNLALIGLFILTQYKFIEKNLSFYGGSAFAMLLHGPGKMLPTVHYSKEFSALFFSAVVFCMVLYFRRCRYVLEVACEKYFLLITPVLLVIVSVLVGLFGYSALLTGSTAALILTIHWMATTGGNWTSSKVSIAKSFAAWKSSNAISHRRKCVAATVAVICGIAILMLPHNAATGKIASSADEYKWMLNWDMKFSTGLSGSMNPTHMALDTQGTLYVVEHGHRVLRVNRNGITEIFAGSLQSGDKDALGTEARFNSISDLVVDRQGNIYVADEGNNKIRKINPKGEVITLLGSGKVGRFISWCKPLECRITAPKALQMLEDGSLIISAGLQLLKLQSNGNALQFLYVQEVKQRPDGVFQTVP